MNRLKHIVTLKNIRQSFGTKEVLKGIDLKVYSGEIFGLLGPSGAGKTTLIKIVTGQLKPTGGEAEFLGKNTTKLSSADYKRMGMMLDNLGLYERLSCYDNLQLFAEICGMSRKRIEEVLRGVGLWESRRIAVSGLSKGMRGRLAFARAILSEPQMLFLDEPTSGLDPATAEGIHQLILEEKEKGTTIFLTTHNMFEAQKLCDHVALLHEGSIVEYGEPGEICRRHNHENRLQIRLTNGEELELINGEASAGRVMELLQMGEIETIHSTEPNMEMVFMELTGRRFV